MKKIYSTPTTNVVELTIQQMICGSIKSSGDNLSVTLGGGDGDFDDNTINARGGGYWDED